MTNWRIRRLDGADVHIFRPLRLDALRLHPEAFAASYEDESEAPLDDLAARLLLPPVAMFGGFVGDALVGATGLHMPIRIKSRHKAVMFFVYVDPVHRRGGLGRALAETAVACARDAGLRVVQLTVTVGNDAARRLYLDLGFRAYGIDHRALLVNGVMYDDELMALDLD